MKILIVDDSRAMRMIVRRTLRQAGFGSHATVEAGNGVEALGVLEKENPDVVLSDWNMPEMDGYGLLKAINERGIKVKFGFITSQFTAEMHNKAREAGALFLLGKPFTPESFKQALSPILG